ncbi:efflux RND transporter outer membrane subunit OprB [soil metagenome]
MTKGLYMRLESSSTVTALRAGMWVIVAAALSACTMIPKYERPAAPVAAQFPGQAASAPASATGQAAADIEWKTFFTDPRLKRLIELSLQNNRDLRVAVLNIEQARAQFQIRRADELPTIAAAATGSRVPGANGSIVSTYTAGLAVSTYELDLFGRVRSLSQQALAQYFATEEASKAAQISLVSSVAIGYLNLLADDELIALTRQTLVTRQDSNRLTQLRFDNGAASELDLRQAQSLVESAKGTLAGQIRQRMLDINALTLLIGQPIPEDLPQGQNLTSQLLADLPAGLPSELLANRPDIRQAEQQLLASNANIGAARAAFFPRISLTGSVGSASNHLSDLFQSGSYAWSFAPQISLPIFDSGRNQATLDASKVGRDIAVAQYERAIQSAFRDVSDALAGRETLLEQLRAQRAQADAEGARFRLSDLRYQNGVSSYLDLLDAQRSLFTAQQAAIQTQATQLQNLVTMYRVLGGGWTQSTAATAPSSISK